MTDSYKEGLKIAHSPFSGMVEAHCQAPINLEEGAEKERSDPKWYPEGILVRGFGFFQILTELALGGRFMTLQPIPRPGAT